MRRMRGSVVSDGLARGTAHIITPGEIHIREGRIAAEDAESEIQRLERALQATRRDIERLQQEARPALGEAIEVIGTYLALLDDHVGLLNPIRVRIRNESLDAPTAVTRRFRELVSEFKSLPEPLPSRVPDLLDLERRILEHLLGRRSGTRLDSLPRKVIIVADDLSPTQTASLDREKVLAFVTDRGGPASHTAILARHLGIPAVVGLGDVTRATRQGDLVLVDGFTGAVTIDPDEETLHNFQMKIRRTQVRSRKFTLAGHALRTRDGEAITVRANIDTGEAAASLNEAGVPGVGLFRTEFLYLGRESAPDEEAQAEHYRQLIKAMAPHPVSIRTFDFGADQFADGLGVPRVPNPFLGVRSIRLAFAHEDLFRAQLRAILLAAPAGRAQIMFPMISDLEEFRRAKAILLSAAEEVRSAGHALDPDIKIGAMIELPAAVLTARDILREADFLSLGTNDLTQYTLAVDRTNAHVASLFRPHHPAVLRLVRMTVDAAAEAGKPLTACGEMAADAHYVPVLLGLGLRRLSLALPRLPVVADVIRRLDLQDCNDLAAGMLASSGPDEAWALLQQFQGSLPRRVPRRSR